MIIYYLPIFLSCIGYFFYRKNTLYLFVLVVFAAFLVGLRGDVDKDYLAYEFLYNLAPDFKEGFIDNFIGYYNHVNMELGFVVLNTFLKFLDIGFNGVFLFHAAISFLFVYYIAKNHYANSYLVFGFLYIFTFIGLWVQIRFGLASLGVLASVFLYHQNKKILAVIPALIAISFHSVSWVFMLVIPIYYVFCFRGITTGLKISVFLFLSLMIAIFDLGEILGRFLSFFNERYEAYSMVEGGTRASFFMRLAIFIIFSTLISPNIFKIPLYRMLFSMALASVFVWSFSWSISVLYRAGVLLELGYCVFLVKEVYASRYRYIIGLCALSILAFWRLLPAVDELKPYTVYWAS